MGEVIKLKIAQVIPNLDLAGAEIMVENLVYEQIKLGHNVFIISLYNLKTPITKRLEEQGVKIYYCDKKDGIDIGIIFRIRKILKKENPDIIHTHLYSLKYALLAKMFLKRKKLIHTIHSTIKSDSGGMELYFNKFSYKILGVTPVVLTKDIKKELISLYKMKRKSKNIRVVENGIDLSKIEKKTSYNLSNNNFNIIHVGRFSTAKNHSALIDAFFLVRKEYENAKLHLIGEGDLQIDIKSKVDKLDLNEDVNFIGKTNEVYKFMIKSDLFILPSFWEGVPISLIEAMAVGLPIIASPFGGITSMLTDKKNALLVIPEPRLIADAILKLIESKDLRKFIGINAFDTSKNYSSKEMAKKYLKIYEEEIKW